MLGDDDIIIIIIIVLYDTSWKKFKMKEKK